MKQTNTHILARTGLVLVLAVFFTSGALAQGQLPNQGSGLVNDPYQISSSTDWNNLADYVAAGHDCSGLFFKMTENIGSETEPITTTIGCQDTNGNRLRFAGNFDGDGHILTVALTSATTNKNYCAPFAYAKNLSIKNLHVVGSVTAKGQFASGLVGSSGNDKSDGTCVIDNCQVNVTLTSKYGTTGTRYSNQGGFIGIAEGDATITNSWFDGKLMGTDFSYSGGFIGINKGKANLNNCLFNPSEIDVDQIITGTSEFVHVIKGELESLVGCYYTKSFSTPQNAQGVKVVTVCPVGSTCDTVISADGNTYYILKGNSEWQQLREALAGTESTIQLSHDLTAGSNDASLEIPQGRTVTLDLNGHTLDRGLSVVGQTQNGYVIKVAEGANLTITDSSNGKAGTIKGGFNKTNGGGIVNQGALTLENVTITGNYASGKGAGVYVVKGSLVVKGDVRVKKNYSLSGVNQNEHDVYLSSNTVINVADAMTQTASIGVEGYKNNAFTSGLDGKGSLNNFFSNEARVVVLVNTDGEAYLSKSVSLTVTGYGESTDSDHWMLIASPLKGKVAPSAVANLIADEATDYDLYRFNMAGQHLWENSKEHSDFVIANGSGYLYANKNDVTLTFEGDFNTNTTESVTLVYDENRNHPEFDGWNLVGNPFPREAYIDKPFYKINAAGTDVEPVDNFNNYSPVTIAPCTGVMVCAQAKDETVTFSTIEPAGDRNQGGLKIAVASTTTLSNAVDDKAIVSFNQGAMLGKFVFNTSNAKLCIPQDGKEYAIASAEKQGETPLNFKAPKTGEYTLTVNPEGVEMSYLHLIDNMTGADVDLLQTPCYTFSARDYDYASRFRLVFSANKNEGESQNEDESFAFISDGNLIVTGTGTLQVIDVLGRQLFSREVHSSLLTPHSSLSPGVYVLRLINGENTKTQKILIK